MISFFFNATATTEISTLSLHDALPIFQSDLPRRPVARPGKGGGARRDRPALGPRRRHGRARRRRLRDGRSEEHTSELQSHSDLVCRLLLEKKKKKENT